MKVEYVLGYILIISGLLVILGVVYQSYNIFIGQALAPEIFKAGALSPVSDQPAKTPTTPEELQKQVETLIGDKIKEMLPAEFIMKILNLISWSIFASILIFAGTQVAGLGIKLVKE